MNDSVLNVTKSNLFILLKKEDVTIFNFLECMKGTLWVKNRPETYDLNLNILELNFRNLQKVLHPDLYSTKSDVLVLCGI